MPRASIRRHKIPAPAQARTFECDCGTSHIAPDATLPVGWSTALGRSWCNDCTTAGIPGRQLNVPRRRRAA